MPALFVSVREGEFVNLAGATMLVAEPSRREDGTWVVFARFGRRLEILRRGSEQECREFVAALAVRLNDEASGR